MKTIRGDKPIIIHITWKYLFSFFLYKIVEQEGRTSPTQERGLASVRRERYWGKGVGG
jgi:hypothetical protein